MQLGDWPPLDLSTRKLDAYPFLTKGGERVAQALELPFDQLSAVTVPKEEGLPQYRDFCQLWLVPGTGQPVLAVYGGSRKLTLRIQEWLCHHTHAQRRDSLHPIPERPQHRKMKARKGREA